MAGTSRDSGSKVRRAGWHGVWATLLLAALALVTVLPAAAQQMRALARLEPDRSSVAVDASGGRLVLALSQAVPYRVFLREEPRRLVVDFRELAWQGIDPVELWRGSGARGGLRFGGAGAGWSRLVLDLPVPLGVETAGMRTDPASGTATITIELAPIAEAEFARRAERARRMAEADRAAAERLRPDAPAPAQEPPWRRQDGMRPLVVVLDPGHGGFDPGAERDGLSEADLVLTFARQLKERLIRTAGMEVYLTRDEDVFVPLPKRVTFARERRADVFISLHADALAEGRATGIAVYTLSDRASDEASALLAEQLDRADLLAGVDLSAQDDLVAGVLMDLVRAETMPRSDKLAKWLVQEIKGQIGRMHKRPLRSAEFSVLRAPDIPSALIELGYISDNRDLERITSREWREKLSAAVESAVLGWAREDAEAAALIRQ